MKVAGPRVRRQRRDGDYSGFLFGFWLRGGQRVVA